MIQFQTHQVSFLLKHRRILRLWIEQTIKDYSIQPDNICFIFCSAAYLLQMNQQFLGHSYYTDVITFPYECQEGFISGDIFIDVETVKDNSKLYGSSYVEEIHRVMIHGVLHLLGQDDLTEQEQKQMHLKEDKALAQLEVIISSYDSKKLSN